MSGRKTSAAYELYGFIPKADNGKYSALCTSCNRVLQNTAAVRLQKHRNSCVAARASGNPSYIPNLETKRQVTQKEVSTQQNEIVNSNVKTEQDIVDFEDLNSENTCENTVVEQDDKSIHTPAALQKMTEPFESFDTTSSVNIDNKLEEIENEDLINIEEELDVIQNLMPRSKESMQLQDELSRVEAVYYRNKAAYFAKLTENTEIKKNLMILQCRKLQLEIEKLTNGS